MEEGAGQQTAACAFQQNKIRPGKGTESQSELMSCSLLLLLAGVLLGGGSSGLFGFLLGGRGGLGFNILGSSGSSDFNTHLSVLTGLSLSFTDSVLLTTSLLLCFNLSNTDLLSLELVDSLNQNVLVLELVTLGGEIEVMIDILGNLLGLSILSKKSPKNSLSSHPEDLGWHSCVFGTLSLTSSGMSTLSLGLMHSSDS